MQWKWWIWPVFRYWTHLIKLWFVQNCQLPYKKTLFGVVVLICTIFSLLRIAIYHARELTWEVDWCVECLQPQIKQSKWSSCLRWIFFTLITFLICNIGVLGWGEQERSKNELSGTLGQSWWSPWPYAWVGSAPTGTTDRWICPKLSGTCEDQ